MKSSEIRRASIEALRDHNRMAVHSARFLDAVAFELAGSPERTWLSFYRHARDIVDGLNSLADVRAVDAPVTHHTSETDLSVIRESDALALMSGFSGVDGHGISSLRHITFRLRRENAVAGCR